MFLSILMNDGLLLSHAFSALSLRFFGEDITVAGREAARKLEEKKKSEEQAVLEENDVMDEDDTNKTGQDP